MTFRDFYEQGTVGGPMGGPNASGALGMSPVGSVKPQLRPVSPQVNPNPPTNSNKIPASTMSPGTQNPPTQPIQPLPGGAFGGGGKKQRYMKV